MRSREMHNKLDRLSGSADDDEQTCPDISLLSPEDQDRVYDVLAKLDGATGEQEISAKIEENVVTVAELNEMFGLWTELPRLGPGEGFTGPNYTIPLNLERHFRYFNSHRLKVTQKVRLVELCRKYGWEGEYPTPRGTTEKSFKRGNTAQILPLNEWDSEDEAELRSL
jgi:hypothetical protein